MLADLATFRVLFAEFSSVSDIEVQIYLDDALGFLSASAWGLCRSKAVLNYAAHNLALSQARKAQASTENDAVIISPTGDIASASAEGLSVSFQAGMAKDSTQSWLNQTPYGQTYMALQRQCLSRGRLSW